MVYSAYTEYYQGSNLAWAQGANIGPGTFRANWALALKDPWPRHKGANWAQATSVPLDWPTVPRPLGALGPRPKGPSGRAPLGANWAWALRGQSSGAFWARAQRANWARAFQGPWAWAQAHSNPSNSSLPALEGRASGRLSSEKEKRMRKII